MSAKPDTQQEGSSVDAIQWLGSNLAKCKEWLGEDWKKAGVDFDHGRITAEYQGEEGHYRDWLVRTADGEVHIVPDSVYAALRTPTEPSEPPGRPSLEAARRRSIALDILGGRVPSPTESLTSEPVDQLRRKWREFGNRTETQPEGQIVLACLKELETALGAPSTVLTSETERERSDEFRQGSHDHYDADMRTAFGDDYGE